MVEYGLILKARQKKIKNSKPREYYFSAINLKHARSKAYSVFKNVKAGKVVVKENTIDIVKGNKVIGWVIYSDYWDTVIYKSLENKWMYELKANGSLGKEFHW